jgi:segregation and condensation protein B
MSLKAKIEAIIYAAEEPVTLEQITALVKDSVPEQEEAKSQVRAALEELVAEYASAERGVEVRQVAGGYRMATKAEYHDVVRAFAKSLKPPMRLSLQALETLAVIAYKQPVTAPEISEIRGVDCSGVVATLLDRKLITTAGRKAVIGRPILYKTSKEFLLRFGLNDLSELPSMEEFEKLAAAESSQPDMFAGAPPEGS